MRLETKTVTILMCVALALSACSKKTITPAVDPQPAEVGFTAASQAVWVKGGETPMTSFPYDNFGVWGIARHQHVESPYILWSTNQLIEVSAPEGTSTNQETSNVVFTPATAAYWLGGYEYSFLAIAPYADAGFTLTGVTTKEDQTSASNPSDFMTVTYDMSSKYASGNYTFDLLGAAAQTSVTTGGYDESQQLVFWHLFSKLAIKVIFVDGDGVEVASNNNAVTSLSISNVNPKGSFTIKYITPAGSMGDLSVVPAADTQAQNKTLEFDAESAKDNEGRWNAHIIPQIISDFVIDVAYNVTGSDGNVTYYDDSISLANSNPSVYAPNGQYNWTIRINPKGGIGFTVDVDQWDEEQIGTDITID